MKNKIFKYDFLIVGGGLIGALAAFALCKKNFNVLVIDVNKLVGLSNIGRTVQVQYEQAKFALDSEFEDLKTELIAEELRLSEIRPTTNVAEFRQLARDFDQRTTEVRESYVERKNNIENVLNVNRRKIFDASVPYLKQILNQTIKSVRDDMENLRFNTAIARITELNNEITKSNTETPREVAEVLIHLIAPLVPHIAEELWEMLGNESSIVYSPFPVPDPTYLISETVEIPIQVNGKFKSKITISAGCSSSDLRDAALADEKIAAIVSDKEIKKEIIVDGKLVNFVI